MNFSAILHQFRTGVSLGAAVFAVATLLSSQAPVPDLGLVLCLLMAVLPRYGPFTLSESVIVAVMLRYGPVATLAACVLAGVSRFQREKRDGGAVKPEFIVYSLSQSWLSYGCAASRSARSVCWKR